jgi:hypothetical protein
MTLPWADIEDESSDTVAPQSPVDESSEFTPIDEFFEPAPPEIPVQHFDTPDPEFLKKQRRANGAAGYQKNIHTHVFKPLFEMAAQHPSTVADSAAIIMYGPKLEMKIGDLAAADPKVARMVDFLSDGPTSSPMAAALVAAFPLFMQLVRNHEPVLEPKPRGFRIPFAKHKDGSPRRFEIKWKVGIKLGRLRNLSHEPSVIESAVFDSPIIKEMLAKQDLTVARTTKSGRRTQRGTTAE